MSESLEYDKEKLYKIYGEFIETGSSVIYFAGLPFVFLSRTGLHDHHALCMDLVAFETSGMTYWDYDCINCVKLLASLAVQVNSKHFTGLPLELYAKLMTRTINELKRHAEKLEKDLEKTAEINLWV